MNLICSYVFFNMSIRINIYYIFRGAVTLCDHAVGNLTFEVVQKRLITLISNNIIDKRILIKQKKWSLQKSVLLN